MSEKNLSNSYCGQSQAYSGNDWGFHLWLGLSPLIISIFITLTIVFGLKYLPSKLPLFYSAPWGERQLATHQQMFVIPVSIAFIALLNLAISWQLHPFQSFFKKVLILSSIVSSLILTIAFVKIILLFI